MSSLSDKLVEADLELILKHTTDEFRCLAGEQIFITGGTGFFGRWLLESFRFANRRLNLKASALVLTRDICRFQRKAPELAGSSEIKFLEGDVCSFDFPSGEFKYIIHCATEASARLNQTNPGLMLETIVQGTHRALCFAQQAKCKHFLLASSGAVYGQQPSTMTHVTESYMGGPSTLEPTSAYAEGKRMAELLATIAANEHGFAVKVARAFAFVGPYLPIDTHFAIGNFIRDGLKGSLITISGDGNPHRSYLYAADLMIWLWTILVRGESARAYNVGSEESHSIAEIAQIVSAAFSPKPSIQIEGLKPAKEISRYVPSTSRARIELGLTAHVSLESAIARTVAWHQAISKDEATKS